MFTQAAVPRMFSIDLVNALCLLPDRPYATAWRNNGHAHPLDVAALARVLGRFGVRSRNLRLPARQAKGYELADFTDAFAKHLPNAPSASEPIPSGVFEI